MLAARNRWECKQVDQEIVHRLSKQLQVDPLVVALCTLRGMSSAEEIDRFLHPDDQPLYDPFLLKGMDLAVERLKIAIARQEKILIYGDYDADGVTSTSLMYKVLTRLGANILYKIPDRFEEGYGLNKEALLAAKETGVNLVLTVDTGISAYEEVEYGKELGLDIIITDHHEPPEQIPQAYAVINPKQKDCSYPFAYLCGAGVSLKLAQALCGELDDEWFALAAIGTIADLVPLIDENRWISVRGLKALAKTRSAGLRALIEESGIDQDEIDAGQIGFAIGPRINAAGRMEHANLALQLLLTEEKEEAIRLAKTLNRLNQERQELVRQITAEADLQAQGYISQGLSSVLVVAGENWHEGVIGIVASKLVERYYRPTVVLSIHPESGMAKGSARSIEGFDLYQNLTKCKDLLTNFGGHTMAAGLSIPTENIPLLREQLCDLARTTLTPEQFKPKMQVDLVCKVSDITISFLEQLSMLAPFGVDNPEPRIMLSDVSIRSQRTVGQQGDHLKWVLEQEGAVIDAIGFQMGEYESLISQNARLHLVAEIGINEWNGIRKPQLYVRDVAILEQQWFDYRGKVQRLQFLQQFPKDYRPLVICFREENYRQLLEKIHEPFEILFIPSWNPAWNEAAAGSDVVHPDGFTDLILYDIPTTYAGIKRIKNVQQFERVWLIFGDEWQQNQLQRLPDRDSFKWLYAYLLQNKKVAIEEKIWEIVKWKKTTEAEVRFMIQVFKDLSIVDEIDGMICIAKPKEKRSFEESATYVREKERIELEQELLFSSVDAIAKWFQ